MYAHYYLAAAVRGEPPGHRLLSFNTGGGTRAHVVNDDDNVPATGCHHDDDARTNGVRQEARREGGVGGDDCVNSLAGCMVQYTITKVSDCQGRGYHGDAPPAGTKRKLVWLEIQTGPNYDPTVIYSGFILRFASTNAAGVTSAEINPSTSWDCAPTGQNIGSGDQSWLPGKKYAGAVEVYLPTDAVELVNGQGGWEWQLS